MNDLTLIHAEDYSAIVAGGTVIEYRRKIHRYEAAGDFSTIKTELVTYGWPAAQATIDYLASARK